MPTENWWTFGITRPVLTKLNDCPRKVAAPRELPVGLMMPSGYGFERLLPLRSGPPLVPT